MTGRGRQFSIPQLEMGARLPVSLWVDADRLSSGRALKLEILMGIDEQLVEEIVKRVLSVGQPERIILFGSAAAGAMTRDSDLDLLVLEREPGDRINEGVRIRSALGDLTYPVDVLVMRTERFEETKNIIGGIAYPAHKYGRVIYEAP